MNDNDTSLRIISDKLAGALSEKGIMSKISYRLKSPYSILKKIIDKNVEFQEVTDVVAFRIIVEDHQADCYKVLDVVRSLYRLIGEKYKDYIIGPKNNGYQGLHLVISYDLPYGEILYTANAEIQIRSRKMHELAEFGEANHHEYKNGQKNNAQRKFSTNLLEIAEIYESLVKANNIYNQFNWQISELIDYQRAMANCWHNCQMRLDNGGVE